MELNDINQLMYSISRVIWRKLVSFFTCFNTGVTPNEVLFDGVPLWKSRTKIIWSRNISEEDDRQTRGLLGHDISMSTSNTKSVIVSFFTLKGEPVQDVFQNPESNLEAEVWYEFGSDQVKIEANIAELASNAETETENTYNNEIQIIFSGQRVGKYSVTLRSNNKLVRGFPTVGNVHPGKADHKSTCIVENRSSTLLITADCRGHETIKVEPRDEYGNKIVNIVDLENLADKFQLVLWKRIDASYQRDDMIINDHHSVVYQGSGLCGDCIHISLSFIIGQEGWYTAQVLLNGRQINMPKMLTLIVISVQDRERVDRIVSNDELTSGSTYFEGEIVGQDGHLFERSKKCKKVYVYLTGKQLIIKEYFLRFIPIKLYTFRLTPTTKINLVHNPSEGMNNESMTNINEYQSIYSTVIEIDDGCQCRPQLLFKDNKFGQQRNGGTLFAACYHKRLLQRIGGSETFLDKQNIFNKKLVEYHQEKGNVRNKLLLKVERWCIVHSSFQVTKWLSDSQWIHLFEIEFEGEPGIDQGGIRREWFEILCREIFKPTFNLFVQAEEGSDAVLPNSKPYQDNFGKNALKMYKFAGKIVGKCLLESAHGSTYRQQLPVRLAKSFLALIVGLRVQFKHFSYDTPEFYATKVRSILTGNVDDEDGGMNDIVFSEEEYMSSESVSQNVKIVDLKPNGSQTKVTESNKHEYLDLLAQYKLCDRFKEKTAAFLDGLHRLVPDSLLSLFDEHELELLLCGIREYSLQDLKKYHIVVGGIFGGPSAKILNWFWLILASFTREQMARLVQFTTGSSQLPHGGFEKLQPMFQIMGSGEKNSLPTAHTCFNMICLPDHNEFNNFEQALLTAITEGNEGFGLV